MNGVLETIREFFAFIVGVIKEFFGFFGSLIPTTEAPTEATSKEVK